MISSVSGRRSPVTARAPGLMIPALCHAMSAVDGPSDSTWSSPILVMTVATGSTTLVGSNRPPAPTSTTAMSTRFTASHLSDKAVQISA
jgi:hypothetical protein